MIYFRVLLVILFFPFSTSALAECNGATIPVIPCKRCTTTGHLIVKQDTACSRFLTIRDDLVLLESRIVKQAKYGRAGTNGANYAYSPHKGFVGKDRFTLNWTLLKSGEVNVTFIDIEVDVVP
jgi:hypothetical protein